MSNWQQESQMFPLPDRANFIYQINISLKVGTSRKIVGIGWQEIDEIWKIRRQNSLETQGIWGIKVNCPTELSDYRHWEYSIIILRIL